MRSIKTTGAQPGEGRRHRPSPLLCPRILPLVGANPAPRMGHMAHPNEPLARTVKTGNPWAVTDRGGHDHEKEGLCDSHPLHESFCRGCLVGCGGSGGAAGSGGGGGAEKPAVDMRTDFIWFKVEVPEASKSRTSQATPPIGPSLSSPRASTPAIASSLSSTPTRTPTSCSTTRPNGRPTLSGPRMTPSSTTARLGATLPIHTRAA